jgi:hypothetical protein
VTAPDPERAVAEARADVLAVFRVLKPTALMNAALNGLIAAARAAPTNCQQEPGYPGERTVMCSLRYPGMVAHDPTEACAIQEPHAWNECAEVHGRAAAAEAKGAADERARLLEGGDR